MAQQWKGKSKGNLLGYNIFVWSLKNLGLNFCYFLLVFVTLYFVLFSPKTGKAIYKFYRKANKFSILKSLFYIWKNYFFLGQTLVDKVAIFIGLKHYFTIEKPFLKDLNALIDEGKPTILIISHLGNFEAAGHLVHLSKKINLLMFEDEVAHIKAFMQNLKVESNINAFTIKYDGSHVFMLAKAMENNEIVCIHGDRFLAGTKTLESDFFGEKASFPYGPYYLTNKFKANAAFVSLIKSGHKKYTLEFQKLDTNNGPQGVLDSYSSTLERLVNKYPESWFNYYDFWGK